MHLVWSVVWSEVISAGSEFLEFLCMKSSVAFPRLGSPVLSQWWLFTASQGHTRKVNAITASFSLQSNFDCGTETCPVFWRNQSKRQNTLISPFC